MHSGNWYLDNTTDLYQIAIQGEGEIDRLLNESLYWDEPYYDDGIIIARGAFEISKYEGDLKVIRYAQAEIAQNEDLRIECVGYQNFAMMALLRIIQTDFESKPMDEEFLKWLKDEHYFRKYDFIQNEETLGLEGALRSFEKEAMEIKDRAAVRSLFLD